MSLEALVDLAAQLRALDGVGVAIAQEARPAVEIEAKRTADAGMSPTGVPWAPRKSDGGNALPNASSAIRAEVSGTTEAVITLVLAYPYVFHQRSKSKDPKKGLPRREVLFNPEEGIPEPIAKAIDAAARKVVARTMGGQR